MYLPLLCDAQKIVPLGLDQLVHVLDLLSGYLHGPNMSVLIKQGRGQRSKGRRVTHMSRGSWGEDGLQAVIELDESA